jgi:hypothetical protein
MAAPETRILDLGKRAELESSDKEKFEELLRQFPIKLHTTPEMDQLFVAKFIVEMPEEFENLKLLIREKKDLVSVILTFEEFLTRSGFDRKYGSGMIFFALCEAARV